MESLNDSDLPDVLQTPNNQGNVTGRKLRSSEGNKTPTTPKTTTGVSSNASTTASKLIKTESAANGIKRLDHLTHIMQTEQKASHTIINDRLAKMEENLTAIADAVTRRSSTDDHGKVKELVASHNKTVAAVMDLRASGAKTDNRLNEFNSMLQQIQQTVARLESQQNNGYELPNPKRRRTGEIAQVDDSMDDVHEVILSPATMTAVPTTTSQAPRPVAQAPRPIPFPQPQSSKPRSHGHRGATSAHAYPSTSSAPSSQPQTASPPNFNSKFINTRYVQLGPLAGWDRNITGQFYALMKEMTACPALNAGPDCIRAHRGKDNFHVNISFSTANDANAFTAAWNAGPPPMYNTVVATLLIQEN
ncbi:hypothetical protein CVT24_013420 [Panaeolus cyanescens]|uniref:Uncharacterized protein n=1 Tax=Panaeolus cyanescens TaxID=181874 RepID=A0A409YMR8_9AGAR|nr:hypothetical protein CVT24_013420 [Panaeolus cyanescens]